MKIHSKIHIFLILLQSYRNHVRPNNLILNYFKCIFNFIAALILFRPFRSHTANSKAGLDTLITATKRQTIAYLLPTKYYPQ